MTVPKYRIVTASENALIVYFDQAISSSQSQQLAMLATMIKSQLGKHIIDTTVSYTSVLITYDLFTCDQLTIKHAVKHIISELVDTESTRQIITLPVYYHTEVAPDLARLAEQKSLSQTQLIKLHSEQTYTVFAIGFAPGFAFLGEVDEQLATPRLDTPRSKVAKGSLGIADRQTAIYPADSPGGWNIIGNCPIDLFSATKSPPIAFNIGDTINFAPIERNEFIRLGGNL